MLASSKLIIVKLIHTIIWVFFNLVLIYMFYAVITNHFDTWFWVCAGLIVMECLVLIFNRWTCPLTPFARKYSKSTKANFDIYLPNWLVKYNKEIYTGLILILILIYLIRTKFEFYSF